MPSLKFPKILVLGGTGFIGSHVVSRAVNKGWETTSISLSGGKDKNCIKGANYLKVDLTSINELNNYEFSKFDYIVNLSGYIDHTPFFSGGRNNIINHFELLLNVIERCGSNIKCFLQIGSSDEYGNLKSPLSEKQRKTDFTLFIGKGCCIIFFRNVK